MGFIIVNTEHLVPTLTVIIAVYTEVSTSALSGVVTVLLIDIIRVTTAEVTVIIARVWTASCARLASRARWILKIPELIIALMGTVVSGG